MLQFLLVHPLEFMKLWSFGTRIQNDFLAKVIFHTVLLLKLSTKISVGGGGGGGLGGGFGQELQPSAA